MYPVYVERSEDKLKDLVLRLKLGLSGLSNKCLYPLSHLTSPHLCLCPVGFVKNRGLFPATNTWSNRISSGPEGKGLGFPDPTSIQSALSHLSHHQELSPRYISNCNVVPHHR